MPPEELRFEVRLFLYGRPLASEEATRIVHHLAPKSVGVTEADILAALTYLQGMEPAQVKSYPNPMGGPRKRWQITTAGVRAHEAGE